MKNFLSRAIDFSATWLPKRPVAYFFLFIIWAVILWFLSEGIPPPKNGPEIPHLDKVAHFGYFFGGAGILSACLGLWRRWKMPEGFLWGVFVVVVIIVGVLIGRLDEYHQTFTPGRSGNDNGDWLADILGAVVGSWVMISGVLPRLILKRNDLISRNDHK